jgi:hypothetical protein
MSCESWPYVEEDSLLVSVGGMFSTYWGLARLVLYRADQDYFISDESQALVMKTLKLGAYMDSVVYELVQRTPSLDSEE